MSLEKTFTDIYRENAWKGDESVSGQGSSMKQTEAIRKVLPHIFKAYDIRSILDIPCGDFLWWPEMKINDLMVGDTDMGNGKKWLDYTGADIVPELIEENRKNFPGVGFRTLNLVEDTLPIVDLVFCRDCLGHLSNENVRKALENIRSSSAKYLMATTYYDPKWITDGDIKDGEWRPINLIKQFGLGYPTLMVNEDYTKNMDFHDKSMGLWKL